CDCLQGGRRRVPRSPSQCPVGRGVTPECRNCGTILPPRRRAYCSDHCSKAYAWRKRLWDQFRMTPEQYNAILAEQDGKCGMCRQFPAKAKRLAVDHEHRDGKAGPVRGLLCFRCNRRVLGNRTLQQVTEMYEYLTNPPALKALGREVWAPGSPARKRRRKR